MLERTLGAQEITLLLACCDGAVDVALESSVAQVTNVVVGLDVFLDSLTAVGNLISQCSSGV